MTRMRLLHRPARWELPPSWRALTPSTSSLSMLAAQIWLRWGLGRRQPGEPPRLMACPRPGLGERALPLCHRTWPRSSHVVPVDARRAIDGRMTTATGLTTTTLHPISMPCIAQHCRWLRPHRAPRLVQSWRVVEVEWALDGKNHGEDGGDAAGRAPSWCTACLPGRWRAVSLPANALAAVDGSPPPTSMGGGRFSHGWRRNLRLSKFNIAKNSSYRSGGSL